MSFFLKSGWLRLFLSKYTQYPKKHKPRPANEAIVYLEDGIKLDIVKYMNNIKI